MSDTQESAATEAVAAPEESAPSSAIRAPSAFTEAELTQAIKDAGLDKTPTRNGVTYHGKAKPVDDAEGTENEPEAKDEDKSKVKAEEPPKPTQSHLSAGYAKLLRQQKAVASKEAALSAREAAVKAADAEIATRRTAWEKEQAEKLSEVERLSKLFDEDEEAVLEAIATRKGKTVAEFYDKLTRRRLNGGERHPTDEVSELKKELDALKTETATQKAEREKRDAEAKAEAEQRAQQQQAAERQAAEQKQFVAHIKGDAKDSFPLLSQEDDAEISKVAWDLAIEHNKREVEAAKAEGRQPQWATFDLVATHLEKQLRYAKWEEEQAAKAEAHEAEEEAPPKAKAQPVAKPAAKAPERPERAKPNAPLPSKPNTITNQMSSVRTGKLAQAPRNEDERLERALAAWK